jgi:hypothetical protein
MLTAAMHATNKKDAVLFLDFYEKWADELKLLF